jgi:hypothetical protein
MLDKMKIQSDIISGMSLREICKRDGLVYARVYYWCKRNDVARDKKFDDTAESRGYVVIRIRESDVKSNPHIFNERILPMIKEICYE